MCNLFIFHKDRQYTKNPESQINLNLNLKYGIRKPKHTELERTIVTIPFPIDQLEAFTPKHILRSCPAFPKDAHQKR